MNWLVSIGLTNAVLATLLAAVAWGIARYWRQPALAHLLWVIVLLKLLTPPLVEIPVGWKLDVAWLPSDAREIKTVAPETSVPLSAELPRLDVEERPAGDRIEASLPAIHAPAKRETRPPADIATRRTSAVHVPDPKFSLREAFRIAIAWLPVIWLCGAGIRAFIFLSRAWRFHAFIRRAGSFDPALSERAWQLAAAAGLKAAPRVITVEGAVSPMLWGAERRVQLIFPTRLAGELPSVARDALLLHELAHYSRGDQWVRLLELAVEVLFWWHPIVWWARHEIEAAEEQCCDAWVVQRQAGSRRTYAEALLATIDFLCEQPAMLPPVASGLGAAPLLRIRLTQIMRGDVAAGLTTTVRTAVLITAMLILPLGPALFGASVSARSGRRARVVSNSSQKMSTSTPTIPSELSAPPASSASGPTESLLSSTTPPPAPRPPAIVTATAISRNGRYRLERRKGSHVTLVNQTTDWRLDMSTHGILCVAFTPDSRLFVTGHEDGLVRVWDTATGGLAATLRGCSDAVWSVAVGSGPVDKYRVAAGAKDGSVLVWDLDSNEEVASLPPSTSGVSCLRWSPHGDNLAISFGDFSVRDQDSLLIWSPLTNILVTQTVLEEPAAALAWIGDDERLVIAHWSGTAQVWNTVDDAPLYNIELGSGGKQIAEAAHWSADCPLVPEWLADALVLGTNSP